MVIQNPDLLSPKCNDVVTVLVPTKLMFPKLFSKQNTRFLFHKLLAPFVWYSWVYPTCDLCAFIPESLPAVSKYYEAIHPTKAALANSLLVIKSYVRICVLSWRCFSVTEDFLDCVPFFNAVSPYSIWGFHGCDSLFYIPVNSDSWMLFFIGNSVLIWKSIMPELNINFFPYPLQFVTYNGVALTEVLSACYWRFEYSKILSYVDW
jgi:hypothetical protein